MSKLNQYIGGIVSSVTNARSMCDMQTVELARQYSEHDLLKHFSIPRMRIEDIEMTIPVAMSAPSETFNYTGLVNAVIDAAMNFFNSGTISRRLSYEIRNAILEMTRSNLNTLVNNSDIQSSIQYNETIRAYCQRVSRYFLVRKVAITSPGNDYTVYEPYPYEQEALESLMWNVVSNTLASDSLAAENMNVIIEASQLREIRREDIIYMKMKIREDGMEWSVSENKDGEMQSKLLPE